jgi:hypothetical protein
MKIEEILFNFFVIFLRLCDGGCEDLFWNLDYLTQNFNNLAKIQHNLGLVHLLRYAKNCKKQTPPLSVTNFVKIFI